MKYNTNIMSMTITKLLLNLKY